MSRQTSNSPPQPDIYVGLLFVAVAALMAGCVFLALELNTYNWAVK